MRSRVMGVSHSFPIWPITPPHNTLIYRTILDSGMAQMPEGAQELESQRLRISRKKERRSIWLRRVSEGQSDPANESPRLL